MNFYYLLKLNREIQTVDENLNLVEVSQYDFWDVDWEEEKEEKIINLAKQNDKNSTIFLNSYENIKIDKNLKVKKIKLLPIVVFKEVTSKKSLIFEITSEFKDFDIDFFMKFQPKRLFYKNEIIECDYSELKRLKEKFEKSLKSLKKFGEYEVREFKFLLEKEVAESFLEKNIFEFLEISIYGKDKLKKYNYSLTKPKINLEIKNKVSLIDEIDVEIENEKISLDKLFSDYEKNGYVLIKNQKGIVDKKYIEKLKRIFKKKNNKFEVSIFDANLLQDVGEINFDKKFFEEFNELEKKDFSYPKLNVTLRDYQKFGIKWLKLLYDYGFGGCLADDMGLGKTIHAIGLIKLIKNFPILIVMPKSLVFNWQQELKNVANLDCLAINSKSDLDNLKEINLITYGFLRNNIEKLKEIEFDTIILDEAQAIKNVNSKISKAVKLLNAKHRFSLSGTPIENNLFELFSIFEFLNPGIFKSIRDFKNDYVNPILNSDEEVAKELKTKISPFILRRLKKEVLDSLPEKEENIIYVEMDKKQQKEYEELKKKLKKELDEKIEEEGFNKSRFLILKILQELRKKVIFYKIEVIKNYLNEAVENNHKVLVFSNFLSVLSEIEKGLDFKYLKMTGVSKNREKIVKEFNENEEIKAMLMTLKVGGVGLNLVSADYVFIVDPWWNVAVENQAIDRVYRIGQKKKVFSYKFIVKNSIEEKILALQQEKKDLASLVIEADAIAKVLDAENIKYLLGE